MTSNDPHGANGTTHEKGDPMKTLKKVLVVLLSLLVLSAALFGCGAKDEPPTEPSDTRILPIPSSFDPTNLEDCSFPVSFTNDDIELNDEGSFVLHMTVWEQELFDAASITGLKEGDVIVVRGDDVSVAAVEQADGVVHINGGLENGGITMAPSESGGTFYESGSELTEYDAMYTSVAQMALPVNGDEFVYRDSSDLEKGEVTYLAGDLLAMKDSVDFGCTAMNGTAHIVNNQVVEIIRVYMP